MDECKVRVVLVDVCRNVEKLIDAEWPSVIDLEP